MKSDRSGRRAFLMAGFGATLAATSRGWADSIHRTQAAGPLIEADEVIEMVTPHRGSQPPVVTTVSVHPDGQWIAAGGDDHVVRIWDRTRKRVIRQLTGHRDWVRSVCFSPSGNSLATAGADGRVYVWDRRTDKMIASLLHCQNPLTAMQYMPDGQSLVLVGFRCQLFIYDLATQAVAQTWKCPCVDMRSVAVSPDSEWIAAGGRNGIIRIWNRRTQTTRSDIRAHRQRIRTILFDAAAQRLVTAGEDRTIYTFDIQTGQPLHRIDNHSSKILSLALLDHDQVAAAGSDNSIRIYDLASGARVAELVGHSGSVAALSRQHNLLVSGSYDTTVRVWNLASIDGIPQQAAGLESGVW